MRNRIEIAIYIHSKNKNRKQTKKKMQNHKNVVYSHTVMPPLTGKKVIHNNIYAAHNNNTRHTVIYNLGNQKKNGFGVDLEIFT